MTQADILMHSSELYGEDFIRVDSKMMILSNLDINATRLEGDEEEN